MPKGTLNKILINDFIINQLRKGNVKFNSVFELIQTEPNLKCSRQPFAEYWKTANKIYTEELEQINQIKIQEAQKNAKKEIKRDILSKEDALEILTQIAKGKQKKIKTDSGDEIIIPSPAEQTKAIAQMSAMLAGWNTPKQSEDVTKKNYTLEELKQQLKDLGIEEE